MHRQLAEWVIPGLLDFVSGCTLNCSCQLNCMAAPFRVKVPTCRCLEFRNLILSAFGCQERAVMNVGCKFVLETRVRAGDARRFTPAVSAPAPGTCHGYSSW